MDQHSGLDLTASGDELTGIFVEDLAESAAPFSTIASLTTLGTATGCASSFSSASSFG